MALRHSTRQEQQVREAVLLAFCDAGSTIRERLGSLSKREWQRLLPWLDTSGLALYFVARLAELKQTDTLPCDLIAHLQCRLAENTERTNGIFSELKDICAAFHNAGVSYAVLKGCSLWPDSVPQLELRSQLDLDFLVDAESAPAAKQILEKYDYHLRAVCGHSWEFKTNAPPGWSLRQLYKHGLSRSAELHIADSDGSSLLARTQRRRIRDIEMPVLSPADLFIGQGKHLFKHVCSEFSRTAHVLEFRRHVVKRYHDLAFWNEVRARSQSNATTRIALGVVTLLITCVMGDFAPTALTEWTVDQLPARARAWIELYGKKIVFVSFPGNKLYLLLQQELVSVGFPGKRSPRRALLPLRLPPLIVHAQEYETQRMRVRRYCAQARFIFFRVKFHVVASLHYWYELTRWRRHISGLAS
jgi:hypothetical protein